MWCTCCDSCKVFIDRFTDRDSLGPSWVVSGSTSLWVVADDKAKGSAGAVARHVGAHWLPANVSSPGSATGKRVLSWSFQAKIKGLSAESRPRLIWKYWEAQPAGPPTWEGGWVEHPATPESKYQWVELDFTLNQLKVGDDVTRLTVPRPLAYGNEYALRVAFTQITVSLTTTYYIDVYLDDKRVVSHYMPQSITGGGMYFGMRVMTGEAEYDDFELRRAENRLGTGVANMAQYGKCEWQMYHPWPLQVLPPPIEPEEPPEGEEPEEPVEPTVKEPPRVITVTVPVQTVLMGPYYYGSGWTEDQQLGCTGDQCGMWSGEHELELYDMPAVNNWNDRTMNTVWRKLFDPPIVCSGSYYDALPGSLPDPDLTTRAMFLWVTRGVGAYAWFARYTDFGTDVGYTTHPNNNRDYLKRAQLLTATFDIDRHPTLVLPIFDAGRSYYNAPNSWNAISRYKLCAGDGDWTVAVPDPQPRAEE